MVEVETLLDIARQILNQAKTRRSGFALPLPPSAASRREEAAVVLEDLLRRGYLVERPLFPTETFWLEAGDPRASVLVITPLGQRAVEAIPSTQALPRGPDGRILSEALPVQATSTKPACDTEAKLAPQGKLAIVLEAISQPDGASLNELQSLTGWRRPSVRAALSRLVTSRRYPVVRRGTGMTARYSVRP